MNRYLSREINSDVVVRRSSSGQWPSWSIMVSGQVGRLVSWAVGVLCLCVD